MYSELITLHSLSEKIRAKRAAKGAIEFDTAEVKVSLDEDGHPIKIELKERKATNLLIEDFMLLANEAVAEHLSKLTSNGSPHFQSLYRVHGEPDADRIENLARSEEHTSELQSQSNLVCRHFFFNDPATTEIYPLSLHDALPTSSNGSPHFQSLYRVHGEPDADRIENLA